MPGVKGRWFGLAASLMSLYKEQLDQAKNELHKKVGKTLAELDPEEMYDTKIFDIFMEAYAKGSPSKEKALITLGRNVYPTIKKIGGIPEHIKTPLDLIKFEALGFLENHTKDVKPRKFIKAEEGNVIVEAPAPGYNCRLYEGVFFGILEMNNIKSGKVTQTKCVKNGESTCEFHIIW
jgi:predicted hydrocarbon binding protein